MFGFRWFSMCFHGKNRLGPALQLPLQLPGTEAIGGQSWRENPWENIGKTWENNGKKTRYPLVNCHITMENHHFLWVNQLWMAMFNSYVCLPDGRFLADGIPIPMSQTSQMRNPTKPYGPWGRLWKFPSARHSTEKMKVNCWRWKMLTSWGKMRIELV